MQDPLRRFGKAAGDYHRYRPEYPRTLFPWLEAGHEAPSGTRILDLACGTGIVTRALCRPGTRVVGVDPNSPMLERAASAGGVHYVRGSAEELPFAARSFDLVTCGQAFHWFDLARAVAELDRVLARGGRAAAFWNVRGSTGIAVDYEALLGVHSGEYARASGDPSTLELLREQLAGRELREVELSNDQSMDFETLFGRARSASYVAHGVADLATFERDLRAAFDRHARDGRVSFPYRTVAIAWPSAT